MEPLCGGSVEEGRLDEQGLWEVRLIGKDTISSYARFDSLNDAIAECKRLVVEQGCRVEEKTLDEDMVARVRENAGRNIAKLTASHSPTPTIRGSTARTTTKHP